MSKERHNAKEKGFIPDQSFEAFTDTPHNRGITAMTTLAQTATFEQTALITVPFYGSNLLVVERNNEPFVPMKSIVENMGLDWASQYTKLKSNAKRWGIAIITIPNVSNLQQAVCLPLRKLCGWMASINPNKVKPEIRDTVVKYQEECDDALYSYWTKGIAINPRATNDYDLITQTLSKISSGNKKLYMSMYNGLIHRFKVGRLSDIPVIDINKAIATAYAIALDWHNKNKPTELKINDGEHYFVVKDGVVIWEKVLKPHCNDLPSNALKSPALMLEHIKQVIGEFIGKTALPPPKNNDSLATVMQSVEIMQGDVDYWQVRDALKTLIATLENHLPYNQVRPVVILLETVERMMMRLWTMIDEANFLALMLQGSAKDNKPLTTRDMDKVSKIISMLGRNLMTLQMPKYQTV